MKEGIFTESGERVETEWENIRDEAADEFAQKPLSEIERTIFANVPQLMQESRPDTIAAFHGFKAGADFGYEQGRRQAWTEAVGG